MSGERVERRLTAILAADVAGYSRLMGQDEPGTLARLRTHRRELIDPKITEHRGRIVKTIGDGLLVEFASVVDGLRCATEWQHRMSAAVVKGLPSVSHQPARNAGPPRCVVSLWKMEHSRSPAPPKLVCRGAPVPNMMPKQICTQSHDRSKRVARFTVE